MLINLFILNLVLLFRLYLFGGKDISANQPNKTFLDSVWKIDCGQLLEFVPGETEYQINPVWERADCTGISRPKPVANHTCCVYEPQSKMYLYGGIVKETREGGGSIGEMYSLELNNHQWQLVKAKPANGNRKNVPGARDEHTAVVHEDTMYIFGGFTGGEGGLATKGGQTVKRSNDLYKYSFKENTWERIKARGHDAPCPRAGHSAVVRHNEQDGDCMYVFGGKDATDHKLNDLWKFNFSTRKWTHVFTDEAPTPRSGHAASIFKDFMIIHGGLLEVTKELNDLHVFDFKNEKWMCFFKYFESPFKPLSFDVTTGTPNSPSGGQENTVSQQGQQHQVYRNLQEIPFLKIKPTDQLYLGKGSIADKLAVKKPTHYLGLPLNARELRNQQQVSFAQTYQLTSKPLPRTLVADQNRPKIRLDDAFSNIMNNKYIVKKWNPTSEMDAGLKKRQQTLNPKGKQAKRHGLV